MMLCVKTLGGIMGLLIDDFENEEFKIGLVRLYIEDFGRKYFRI